MIVDKIKELKELGKYAPLVKNGIIPLKVNYYFEVYELFNIKMILNASLKNKRMQSITDVSQAFKCSENTVRNAINLMLQETL